MAAAAKPAWSPAVCLLGATATSKPCTMGRAWRWSVWRAASCIYTAADTARVAYSALVCASSADNKSSMF